ncbi:MAG: CatB-related O-acetyltransferase [Acidobacteriaceae bacterium]
MARTSIYQRLGNAVRTFYMFGLRYRWVLYGRDVHVQTTSTFFSPRRIAVIGDHVGIGAYCEFGCDIHIGHHVLIASHCGFLSRDAHTYDLPGTTMFDGPRSDRQGIVIEDDVWIGFGVIVLSGVTIGRGSVIAAGAVVSQDVPPYSIVAGNPARVVKERFRADQIEEHERVLRSRGLFVESTTKARGRSQPTSLQY